MAVVFVTRLENGETKNEGLCLKCAKELEIPQVNDILEKMGISDEDLEEMANATSDLFDEGESFEQGGSSTMPELFGNIMGGLEKLFGGAQMPPSSFDGAEPLSAELAELKNILIHTKASEIPNIYNIF